MEYMIAADLGGPTGQKPCFQAPKHHSKQQFKVLKSKLKHYQINLLHRGEAELRTTWDTKHESRKLWTSSIDKAKFEHRGEVALRIYKQKYDRQRYWEKLNE